MSDDEAGPVFSRARMDWDALPTEFDRTFVGKLNAGAVMRIEEEGDQHLTPEQMTSFRESLAALIPRTVLPSKLIGRMNNISAKLGQNAELTKFAARQSEIAEQLTASFQRPHVPVIDTTGLDDTLKKSAKRKAKKEREREEREHLMIDLLAATSKSTAALVKNADAQERRINAQSLLTNFLAFAVVFDVVNGAFDNHTWWTSAIAGGVGLLAVAATIGIGYLWSKREPAKE